MATLCINRSKAVFNAHVPVLQTTEEPGLISDEVYANFELYMTSWVTLILVTVPGIVNNIIIIIVFRKQGYKVNVNISLTAIAFWDLTKCLTATVFRLYGPIKLFSEADSLSWKNIGAMTLAYAYVHCGHASFSLAAYVSFERFLCVTMPLKIKRILTPRTTLIAVIAISVFVFACLSIVHLFFEITWSYDPHFNTTIATFKHTKFYVEHEELLLTYYSFANITIPSINFIVIVIFTSVIAKRLRDSTHFRRRHQARIPARVVKALSHSVMASVKRVYMKKLEQDGCHNGQSVQQGSPVKELSAVVAIPGLTNTGRDCNANVSLTTVRLKEHTCDDLHNIETTKQDNRTTEPSTVVELSEVNNREQDCNTSVSLTTDSQKDPLCDDLHYNDTAEQKNQNIAPKKGSDSSVHVIDTREQECDSNAKCMDILDECDKCFSSVQNTNQKLSQDGLKELNISDLATNAPDPNTQCVDENNSILSYYKSGSPSPSAPEAALDQTSKKKCPPPQESRCPRMSSREQQTIRLLITLLAVYILVFLPRVAVYIGAAVEPEFYVLRRYDRLFRMCAAILHFFDFFNAVVNLFIFLKMSSQFKATFHSIFSCKRH